LEIWAHRGASAHAPENTLAAFRTAEQLGADGIELDVQRSRDGVAVVIHDATLQRTTQGRGPVAEYTVAELKKLDAGFKFGPPFRGERIPTLAEALDCVKSTRLRVNIHLKSVGPAGFLLEQSVLLEIAAAGFLPRTVVSSFQQDVLHRMRQREPSLELAILCTEFAPVHPMQAMRTGLQAIHPQLGVVFPAYMQNALALGVQVRPFTVNTEADIRRMAAWGAHGVITDDPRLARHVLESV
jgi:glycerophosphoryl diester phosphodiesterase